MERSTARLTYKGSISEAIIEAQNQKKLFLVFISGEDENSTNLENTTWLDDKVAAAVSMYCIFLHFIEGHVEASQFAAIYPQNSVPSISAVGYNGVMLWQHEGYINGRSFVESIEKAWASMHFQSTAAALLSTALSSKEPVPSRSSSTAVSHIEQAELSSLHDSSFLADSLALNVGAEPSNDPEALIKQLGEDISMDDNPLQLGNVNEAKVDMENNKNKENEATEISHSETQNLPNFQDVPQEHHSFENPTKSFSEPVGAIHLSRSGSSQANSNYSDEGRQPVYNEMNVLNAKKFTIQLSIRMPNGVSLQEKFTVTDILRSVKNFVDDNYDSNLGSYDLAIPYPRKVFGEEDMSKALSELAFDSRQALIVIPKSEVPRHQSSLLSASNDIQSSANQTNNGIGYFGYLKRAVSYMNPFSYLGGNNSSSSSEQEGTPNNDDLWQYRGRDARPQNGSHSSNPQSTNGSILRSRATSRPFGSNIHTLRHDEDDFSSSDRNTFWNGTLGAAGFLTYIKRRGRRIGEEDSSMAKDRLMVMAGCLVLLAGLAAAVVSAPAAVAGAHPHPEEIEQKKIRLEEVVGRGRDCSYRVRIKTSCRSPRLTRDAIAISFGDAYNNQVYAAHLDDPWSKTFERCSTDTFDIYGPCGYGVCYLYLWRDGSDGWIPDWVDVYDPYYAHFVTFTYGSSIPPRLWYGFNRCTRQQHSLHSSSTAQASA